MRTIVSCCLAFTTFVAQAERTECIDSVEILDEVVVTAIRENRPLRKQALSSAALEGRRLSSVGVQSFKDLQTEVAGLFIPSYGSRQNTPIYIRGIGSRINTPAVALYLNDVPLLSKSSYDFSLANVDKVEVLRGPQNTLYGHGAMGGLIRVTTKSPLDHQGTTIERRTGRYCTQRVSFNRMQKIGDKLGMSFGSSFLHDGGYFKNKYSAHEVDWDNDFQTTLRLAARPSATVNLDFQASYEYSSQGTFPYIMESVAKGDFFAEDITADLGSVASNRDGRYKRNLANASLKAEHHWSKVVLSNVVGYQYLKDEMEMDQDFTRMDIYTLQQRQRGHTLSEEIAVKSQPGAWRHWEWSTGLSANAQWLTTMAPVTFYADGIRWLNGMMNGMANAKLPNVQSGPMTMDFVFDDQIQGSSLLFDGEFDTPAYGAALYHQSTLRNVLGIKGLDITAGLRLDYERLRLRYLSQYDFSHLYSLSGHLSSPTMERDVSMVPAAMYEAQQVMDGLLRKDYVQLLPRFSIQYSQKGWNVYGTISRGHRSGGYNIQMFSEILQSMMRTDIMSDVARVTIPVLQAQGAVPQSTKDNVTNLLNGMAAGEDIDVSERLLYRPEFAWNYEVGGHADMLGGRLQADVSAYLTRITDQQISQMTGSGLGRVTTNAGRSRSLGGEVSLVVRPTDYLTVRGAYGYCRATFLGSKASENVSYEGNRVPFVPKHTMNVNARYSRPCKRLIDRWSVETSWHGVDGIYWTEDNTVCEPFYATLDARVSGVYKAMEVGLWGANLTNASYRTFFFETMGRGFGQRCRPLQFGFDVKLTL